MSDVFIHSMDSTSHTHLLGPSLRRVPVVSLRLGALLPLLLLLRPLLRHRVARPGGCPHRLLLLHLLLFEVVTKRKRRGEKECV